MSEDPDRRKFLKVSTCGIAGGVGFIATIPVVRVLAYPSGEQTVKTPTEPIDIGSASRFLIDEPPRRVDVIAPVIQDAWTAARDVVLGAAWIRRTGPGLDELDARSAICPHLGCAVGFDRAAKNFLCPCHDSRFAISGDKLSGPSERGLDPLPLQVIDGRIKLTWVRYRIGTSNRERA